jgi:uncharacterized glyoxalase superfamily protein PhnB
MGDMTTIEVKAFVPARDFARSKLFYEALGFSVVWSSEQLAYIAHGGSSFLLQNFYEKAHADNFMMHLLVTDVDAWWRHVVDQQLAQRFGVMTQPPDDRPWGIRDFVITDPTGVLWRVGQNIAGS